MALQLDLKLTNSGRNALWNSKNTGVNLELTHIQFGSRNRVTTGEEISLVQPKQYSAIGAGSKIAQDQIRVMTTMIGGENYNVAEIGIWSGVPNTVGSTLVAYTSIPTGFIAQMVSGIDLVFSYDMVLSTEDLNSITIIMDSDQSSTLSLLEAHENDRNAHPFYVTLDTAQTIESPKTFTSMVTFNGGLTGNVTGSVSGSASKLATARSISLSGAVTGTATNFDGTSNITIPVTSVDATKLTGTASINTTGNATTATRLATAITIAISGGATGTATSFNGSSSITIPITALDASKLVGTIAEARIPILNQNTTGNAATSTLAAAATKLAAARKINNILFDGTTDVTISNLPVEVTIGTGQSEGYQILKFGNYNKVVGAGLAQYIQTGKWLSESGRQIGFSLMNDAGAQVSALILGTTAAYFMDGSTATALARLTDNVASATKLANPRKINGVSFDGTGNIAIPALVTLISTTGSDLNNYQEAGFFGCILNATTQTLLNCPTSVAFSLLIEKGAGIVQTLTEYLPTGTPKTYKRHSYGGTWGAWYEILTTLNPDTTKLPLTGGTVTGATTFNTILSLKAGINSTIPVSFLNSGSAQAINTGGVLVSNSYSDTSLVPTNGIYSKGDIKVASNLLLSADNSMLSVGNNGDIGFIKQAGKGAVLAVGANNSFQVVKMSTAALSVASSITSLLTLSNTGILSSIGGYVGDVTGTADKAIQLTPPTINRALKPVDTPKSSMGAYFTSIGGMTGAANEMYADMLTMNSYSDATGGKANALVFAKDSSNIYHYQAAQSATTWGTAKRLAYDTDNVASATKLETPRAINGVNFDGSANITITADLPLIGSITNQTTLDAATTAGKYLVVAYGIAGLYGYGVLHVYKLGDTIHQTYYAHQGSALGSVAVRQMWNGAFTVWRCLDPSNVASATKLATPRKINNVNFDGTSDITIKATNMRIGTVLWHLGSRSGINTGDLACDGQLVSRNTYADLWNMVNTGTLASVTDAVWLANPSKRACFSLGDGSTTFRLPDLNGAYSGSIANLFLRGTADQIANPAGTVVSDAIRNITGSLGSIRTFSTSPSLSGSFYLDGGAGGSISGASGTGYPSVGFDASLVVPTATENRPVSAFGVWVITALGADLVVPPASTAATLTGGNTFNGSQNIVGDVTVNGNLSGTNIIANKFNTTVGNAPCYAVRAWADWDGVNNILNASGNVSSVTDNGVGDYTFNLTTALPDIKYAVSATLKRSGDGNAFVYEVGTRTTTACQLRTKADDAGQADGEMSMIMVR